MAKLIYTDGTKSINVWEDDRPGVWSPDSRDAAKAAKSAKLVPSVYAAITARMQAMADLPFTIYTVEGDIEVDNSDNYRNAVGFLPDPYSFLAKTEGALVTAGRSYWYKGTGTKTGKVKELRYWLPNSVTLNPQALTKGEILFQRQGANNTFPEASVLYTWLLDPDVELGPPTIYPLESALLSAEANGLINKWVADYMRRGAIKAMLLMVDGMPPEGEVEKIENWFNRFLSGVRGLQWKVFNSAGVKPTIIGDGLEALRDLSISQDLRYEIHTAMGTRHLLEDENYATANARERQFYQMTIVPDARIIQAAMNNQVMNGAGYHIEFEPERLESFQEDENEQATAFLNLFNGLREVMSVDAAFELAAQKLDYEFTDEQREIIKKGILEKNPAPIEIETEPETDNRALVELQRWEKKVKQAGKMVTWYPAHIPSDVAKSVSDGVVTFEQARKELAKVADPSELKALADAINRAADKQTINVTMPPVVVNVGKEEK